MEEYIDKAFPVIIDYTVVDMGPKSFLDSFVQSILDITKQHVLTLLADTMNPR
jgi:hypothetical protein